MPQESLTGFARSVAVHRSPQAGYLLAAAFRAANDWSGGGAGVIACDSAQAAAPIWMRKGYDIVVGQLVATARECL